MAGFRFSNSEVEAIAKPGQAEWTHNSGTFTWIVPNGVYSIGAVCIGGGGGGAASGTNAASGGSGGSLTWVNNIPVTPGESLTVVVGGGGGNAVGTGTPGGAGGISSIARGGTVLISAAAGGGGVIGINGSSGLSGSSVWPANSVFGNEVGGLSVTTAAAVSERCSGGGAAGGYAIGSGSTGSNGLGSGTSTTSASGGGSGGIGGTSNTNAGGGGGTGPWGKGSNGTGVSGAGFSGIGGSLGNPLSSIGSINSRTATQWAAGGNGIHGGLFGGGGGGGLSNNPGTASGFGARGCVRIIWGVGRGFPDNAGNVTDTNTAVATSQQVYTTPGTYSWVVPAGVTTFSFVCIGGGGAGNQGSATNVGKGGGGGGALLYGSYRCTPGETYTIVAGAGGQSTGGNTSSAGGASSISRSISFQGFISGTSLFVTRLISSTVLINNATYSGSGATNFTVTAFVTGERGREGTYTVSVSQTVGTLQSPVTFTATLVMASAGGGGAPATSGTGAGTGGAAGSSITYVSDSAFPLGATSYNGGAGGNNSTSTTGQGGGGGGAGGYGGAAGAGAPAGAIANGNNPPGGGAASNFSGAAAGGANGGTSLACGAGGGGVGIYGWGLDPNILNFTNTAGPVVNQGWGGSGGTDGSARGSSGLGGIYGGGGGGAGNWSAGRSHGGKGAVRIIWGRMPYPGVTVDV